MITKWDSQHFPPHITGQLQLTQQFRQPILQFKIQFETFRCDRAIGQKKLILHKAFFWSPQKAKELGDYLEMPFSVDQLLLIENQLHTPNKDLQILMIDPKINQVLHMDQLRPYLPEKLQNVKLHDAKINQKSSEHQVQKFIGDYSGHDVHLLGLA